MSVRILSTCLACVSVDGEFTKDVLSIEMNFI